MCGRLFLAVVVLGGEACGEDGGVGVRVDGGAYVEEVDDWHEGRVEDCPDDVEFPLQSLDTDWGDFDHCVMSAGFVSDSWKSGLPMKLKIQFVAVPLL